ncbi:glycine--tRNA ligase [Candidatus Pacearchaeota archaeon]|nr:glycine--tRNA ligase [Candidatus Pacearchaeota archaeon]
MAGKPENNRADEISAIACKRGFFFPTADIYGGKSGFFTYGHLGKLMKIKWENLWRNFFLKEENYYEIQGNNILPEKVFIASGHIENFNDPLAECKNCHFRFKADQLLEDSKPYTDGMSLGEMNSLIGKKKLKCPKCNGGLSEVKWFNMMFPVSIGFAGEKGYLSPETAQSAYLAFNQEFDATRKKLPLGLAIIDKAYRNEISPRQLFFRLREFTQAELQIFFDADEIDKLNPEKWEGIENLKLNVKLAEEKEAKEISCKELHKKFPKFYLYNAAKIQGFYLDILKIPKEKFRFRELSEEERAFYNKIHMDIELDLETLGGFKEVAGLHYRTDHDLKGHEKISGKNLEIFHNNKKLIPHVLELSFGVDRNIWAFLDIFYKKEKVDKEERAIFRFPMAMAPFEAAVFPLVNKDGLDKEAEKVYEMLKDSKIKVFYDDSGSIGRRYRRQDEVGTKFCITLDYDSMKQKDVTIRERDSMKQERVKISDLPKILREKIRA